MKLSEVTQKPLKLSQVSVAATPVQTAPEIPQEKPSLLSRSMDRLRLGASDSLSTMMGDTYGRSGDPVQRDDLGYVGQRVKALGGDIIPAVGEVASDAAITAGKAILPQTWQDKIASGAQSVANSAPVQLAGKGLDAWKSASPETYATAGEVANIGLAAAPIPNIPLKDFGGAARLAKSVEKTRLKELKNVFTPDKPLTGKFPSGNIVENNNLLRTTEFIPSPTYQKMLDEVANIPGVDPRRSAAKNRMTLEKSISNTQKSLHEKLVGEPPIPRSEVINVLDDAKDRIIQEPIIVGDAVSSAQKYANQFEKIVDSKMVNGAIAPKDLIDARIEFDRLVPKDTLTPGGTAGHVTTRQLRQSINNLVEQKVPTAGVKQDLNKMHQMLKADTFLKGVSEKEGGNRLSRALASYERRTGIKHAVNPISASRTIMDAPALLYSGLAATLFGGAKKAGEGLFRNAVSTEQMLASAMRNSPELASKGIIIDTLNKKKATGE